MLSHSIISGNIKPQITVKAFQATVNTLQAYLVITLFMHYTDM